MTVKDLLNYYKYVNKVKKFIYVLKCRYNYVKMKK